MPISIISVISTKWSSTHWPPFTKVVRTFSTPAYVVLWVGTESTLRAHFKHSQSKFAALLGISVDILQKWEPKRRRHEGPAEYLCLVRRGCHEFGPGTIQIALHMYR